MNIVYYTSGSTGAGRLFRAIAVSNALRRNSINAELTLIHHSEMNFIPEYFSLPAIKMAPARIESRESYESFSQNLLDTIEQIDPDLLIIDLQWAIVKGILSRINCKKIFIHRYVNRSYYSFVLDNRSTSFDPDDYDEIYHIEPFYPDFRSIELHPFVLRNRDEIYSKEEACKMLDLRAERQNALVMTNGMPGEIDILAQKSADLINKEFEVIKSTNYENGLLPALDYFNAFDLVLCSGGYNSAWECVYFDKNCILLPFKRRFDDQSWRIKRTEDSDFTINGADQFVKRITC